MLCDVLKLWITLFPPILPDHLKEPLSILRKFIFAHPRNIQHFRLGRRFFCCHIDQGLVTENNIRWHAFLTCYFKAEFLKLLKQLVAGRCKCFHTLCFLFRFGGLFRLFIFICDLNGNRSRRIFKATDIAKFENLIISHTKISL